MPLRFVILGGGPAGNTAATTAARLGAEVTMIERDIVGGAAHLWDCIPSKAMIATAAAMGDVRAGAGMGLSVAPPQLDLEGLRNRIKSIEAKLEHNIVDLLRSQNVRIIHGTGRLKGPHEIVVETPEGVREVEADAILIATGSRPRIPDWATPDGERVLTTRDAYPPRELPEHLVVIGSGVTGVEFVHMFSSLGSKVTLIVSRQQVLPQKDPEVAASLVQRAEAAGYRAIVVTLDTFMLGWRPTDLDTAYLPFLQGTGIANYLTDPAFNAPLPEGAPLSDKVFRWAGMFGNPRLTWDDLAWLRERTSLPIVLKGVLHPDDARAAADAGVDGIVVSNHGGRQVDGAVAALDALPAIVEAVGDRLTVLLDSGVRNGADVVKAVALGAAAVLYGRPYVYGLALGGQAGVTHVLRCLLGELDATVALAGRRRLADLGPDVLAPSPS